MKEIKAKLFLCCALNACFLCSCFSIGKKDSNTSSSTARLKIVSWNAETFFDSTTDGTEYTEFKKSGSRWGKEAYIVRLDRLCHVIKKLNADVFAIEEIENSAILYDISNRLAGNGFKRKAYTYACFAKEKNSAIGCAVLSRYQIADFKVHSLQIESERSKQPSLRPILELTVFVKRRPLTLFVNHWKSMSGGENNSEVWRRWQESILSERMEYFVSENSDARAILACGDFNRNISSFYLYRPEESFSENKCNVLFNYIRPKFIENENKLQSGKVAVYSPWIQNDGTILPAGSYCYKGQWNYIDHFFSCGSAEIKDFAVESDGDWADKDGRPIGYKIYTGSGYSDHLPISCIAEF